jgi:hypothetical protein
MPRTLQFRRLPAATLANTTGAIGELIVNSNNYTLTVHDGALPGGYALLNSATDSNIDQFARNTANTANSNIIILQGVDTTQNTNITTATNLAQAAFNTANTANTRTVSSLVNGANTVTLAANGATIFPGGSQIRRGWPGRSGIPFDDSHWFMPPGGSRFGGIMSADGQQYIQTNNLGGGISIGTNYIGSTANVWVFGTDGTLTFPNSSVQTGGSISRIELKALVANAATYAAFQSAIAAL